MSKMGFPERKNISMPQKKKVVKKTKIKKKKVASLPVNNKVKTVKVRKIRFGLIFLILLIISLIIYLFFSLVKFPIRNIFVIGNSILSDQEIIELAGIQNYPSIIGTTCSSMESKIEKNEFVKEATVVKKNFKEVYITVEENTPIFYNKTTNKTILKNSKEHTGELDVPILINYIPDTIYKTFVSKMLEVDLEILERISEIKYDPNTVDDERFLLTMNDGNYVYLTLESYDSINNYIDIIKNFQNKKGVLYLDSGEYFKILEN